MDCHDAHLITISMLLRQSQDHQTYFRIKINKYTIADFNFKFCYETWNSVFEGDDINKIYNSF